MTTDRRTALITGAGQNIGKACALALAADGYNIAINGRRKREQCDAVGEEVRALGVEAEVFMGDVGTEEVANQIAQDAMQRFGGIDILVHNAALRPEKPFLEMDLAADWHHIMDVNFTASVWLSRAVLPGMVARGWGRIINFAGMNAINGYNGRAPVSASKHAAWGLTKALAKEFGPQGITVNIVSPGPIQSDHDDPAMTAHIESQKSRIPMGRLGTPSEVAQMVSLLASESGAFVNGQMLQVNGGAQT